MGDADPVQPGAETALHLERQAACKSPEVGHLGGILRGDDEPEMMPVVEAASREGYSVGSVLGSAERAALLAVPRDVVALEVGDVGRQRRRAEGTPAMADRPGLDDDATIGGEQAAAAEGGPAAVARSAYATLLAVTELLSDDRQLLCAPNHIEGQILH
jgi:hypothetical protein